MKKIVSAILALSFLPCFSAAALPAVTPAEVAVRPDMGAETQIIVDKSASKMQINFAKGFVIGQRYTVPSRLRTVTFRCISWADNVGKTKVSVYKWDSDYTKTTSAKPIVSFVTEDLLDNLENTIAIPESANISGDILITFAPEYAGCAENVGTNLVDSGSAHVKQTTYLNGEEQTALAFVSTITYDADLSLPDLSASAKKNAYEKIPAVNYDYSYNGENITNTLTDPETGEPSIANFPHGAIVGYGNVDFGNTSPKGVTMRIQERNVNHNMGEVQMYLDDPNKNECIAAFRFFDEAVDPRAMDVTAQITQNITGVHNVYLILCGSGYGVTNFSFSAEKLPLSSWEQRIADFEPTTKKDIIYDYSDTWVATDMLGRKLPDNSVTGDRKEDKQVGMFYWTWHARKDLPNSETHSNIQILLDSYPGDVSEIKNNPDWPYWKSAMWNESVYGYYGGSDKWVMRKQMELFAAADVDALFFDCTNGDWTWANGYMDLAEVIHDMKKDGIKAPGMSFITSFYADKNTRTQIVNAYENMYQHGLYSDTWYYFDGKPLMLGTKSAFDVVSDNEDVTNLYRDIQDFFTWRSVQPSYFKGQTEPDQWCWLEIYPQNLYNNGEMVSVGVAQNATGTSITPMNGDNVYGRSYTYKNGYTQLSETSKYYGYNFEEQWERALELDPEFVFVTGWNEWQADKFDEWMGFKAAYPDLYNDEYSRDIEPTKGDFKDNYYLQLAKYIRLFKGTNKTPLASSEKTIDITGDFAQWNDVGPEFIAYKGGVEPRDCEGYMINSKNHYTNNSGRNDIVLTKAARDTENIWFYVETADNLTPCTDPAWMRLLINTDRSYKTGWEGYDYIINRANPTSDTVTVEKSAGGWNWENVGTGEYKMDGNKMMIKLSRDMLGLSGKAIDIEFKWNDNGLPLVSDNLDADIMSFYTEGDTAPVGRYNYHFTEKPAKAVDEPVIPGRTGKDKLKIGTVMAINSSNAMLVGNITRIDPANPAVTPLIINDKTLIPIRFLSESTGAEVIWHAETSTAQINYAGKRIMVTENSDIMKIEKDSVRLQTPAQTINDRMYVPLRDIVEALDMQCHWYEPGVILIGKNIYSIAFDENVTEFLSDLYGVKID